MCGNIIIEVGFGNRPKVVSEQGERRGYIRAIAESLRKTYQEINGVRHHFDDKETIIELYKLMSK